MRALAVAFLTVVGLACLHGVLYHLHTILVPFVLSGFLVLALQPSVESLYSLLAGRKRPFRWCCCGPRRRRGKPRSLQSSPRSHEDGLRAAEEQQAEEAPPEQAEGGEAVGWSWEFLEQLADGLCRFLAVSVMLWGLLVTALLVILLLCHGAFHMKDNWSSYRAGLERLEGWQDGIIDAASREFHLTKAMENRLKEGYYEILSQTQDGVWAVVNSIVTSVSEGLSSTVLLLLYLLFWLLAPLPTGGKAGALVRSYIYKKTIVSFFFGLCVAGLFLLLGVDLAVLFGVISFFLNYVPEVGAFISMIGPIPVILLDGRIDRPFLVLGEALMGQLMLKFLFSNVLEVKLIERDREMSIHPVWVILGLSYFGFVWGPIGMLISVPIMAMLKTAALSASRGQDGTPLGELPGLAQVVLACFEGRKVRYRDILDVGSSSATPVAATPLRR